MDRLTSKNGNLLALQGYFEEQNAQMKIPVGAFVHCACEAFKRLAEYENTGYTPEDIKLAMSLALPSGAVAGASEQRVSQRIQSNGYISRDDF